MLPRPGRKIVNLLRDNELIYGRLLPVDEPHLIERYNKALVAFGLQADQAQIFRDRPHRLLAAGRRGTRRSTQYLDPNEVNRRFIILTPSQQDLPVVHTAFSNTSQLVYEFFEKNARAIDALTIKDVIYGEIEDSVVQGRGHRGPASRSTRSSSACCRPRTCSARRPSSARWSTG